MPTFDDANPNSTPLEGSSGLLRVPEPGIEAQDVQAPERAAGGHTADPADGSLRDRYAKAIHHYDYEHGLSGNDLPSKHHRGEADAVLAVRDRELARLRAQVAAARSFAEEMRGYCSWQGISAMYADRLDARLDAAAEAGR